MYKKFKEIDKKKKWVALWSEEYSYIYMYMMIRFSKLFSGKSKPWPDRQTRKPKPQTIILSDENDSCMLVSECNNNM